jgi:hypothetical protein
MEFIAFIIHIAAAVVFSLHAVVSRQRGYWLPALLLVPVLAALIYLLAVVLPELRFDRRVRKLAAARRPRPKSASQEKALFDYSEAPSLENRLRLAATLLDDGYVDQALRHYEECLSGPFGDDPDVRRGAARARQMAGQAVAAASRRSSLGQAVLGQPV